MQIIARAILLCTTLALSACGALTFTAANAPTHSGDIITKSDIAYGQRDDQKLDIYAPAKTTEPTPVVMFLYGGRWKYGSKDQYRFVAAALVKQGYIVVIPDYRKYPDVKFPAFVDDAATALAWIADNISQYGGNPAQINVAGHSAGAHIGALLATDPQYLGAHGKDRNIIHSFAGLSGPYAFTPDEPDLIDIFGPPARYPQMQAPNFVDGRQPPMLLLWGADDTTVGQFNLDKLKTAVDAKGGCVLTKIYPETSHISIMRGFTWLGNKHAPVVADMAEFFRSAEHKSPCL